VQQQKREKSAVTSRSRKKASFRGDTERVHRKAVKRLLAKLNVSYTVLLT